MKILYLVTTIFATIAVPVTAQTEQEAPRSTQQDLQALPVAPTFSGLKIGADIDYRWTKADYPPPTVSSTIDRKKGGVGYSVHLGYDTQIGSALIIGSEVSVGRSAADLSSESAKGNYTLKPRWALDVSSRAGMLVAPSALLYGRVGFSLLRLREKIDFSAISDRDFKTRGTANGFLVGGGIETAITPGLFVRAEYDHVDYGKGLTTSKALFGINAGFS